jgi:hypothetical protein
MPTAWLPKPLPWIPPDYSDDVVMAVRAFEAGNANEAQQKMVWRYLMYVTKATDEFQDLSFRPGGGTAGAPGEATNFAEGSRFVGMMFRKLLRAELTPKPPVTSVPLPVQKRMKARRASSARAQKAII